MLAHAHTQEVATWKGSNGSLSSLNTVSLLLLVSLWGFYSGN